MPLATLGRDSLFSKFHHCQTAPSIEYSQGGRMYEASFSCRRWMLVDVIFTPPKAAVVSMAEKIRAWCPESTSLSVARGGSGGLALTMAETFDIVHAFEADKERSACLKHNVELAEKDWVLVHGPATEEEGDYLFALEEIESDVLLVSLLCDDHDTQGVCEQTRALPPQPQPRAPPYALNARGSVFLAAPRAGQ